MFLSKKCTYGLQALFLLAEGDGTPLLAKTIAQTLDIPQPFLSKILQDLSKGGLLNSCRGRRGGFRLAHPASEVKLLRVIELLEGKLFKDQCVLGSSECSEKNICLIRGQCAPIRNEVWRIFGKMNLEQLLEETGDSPMQSLPGVFAESASAQ